MFKTVLLVEDDEQYAYIFHHAAGLVRPDIHYHHARDGRAALALLREGIVPDLVFMDIHMPYMDGFECTAAIKADALLQHLPVIIQSTDDHSGSMKDAFAAGALSFISKPTDYAEFRSMLAFILSHTSVAGLMANSTAYPGLYFPG